MNRSNNQGILNLEWSLRSSATIVIIARRNPSTVGLCSIETTGCLKRWGSILPSVGFHILRTGRVREINER